MTTLYTIRDWERCYTVSQNRKNDASKPLPWVAMRTKHDGKGFRRVMRLPDSMALMGAWMLIVEVAAKCPTHGVLADADGPLTAIDLADKTGGDEAVFQRALEVFSTKDIAWLSTTASECSTTAFGLRDETRRNGTRRDGTERNETESNNPTPTVGLDRPATLDRVKSVKSGFCKDSVVTEETLSSVDSLDRWMDHDLKRSDSICDSSEEFRVNAHSAAAKARSVPGIRNRVAFFKWLVKGRNWNYLRLSDDDAAAMLHRERERSESLEVQSLLSSFLEKTKLPQGIA